MHLFVGALLVVSGLSALRYVWAGASGLEREPPLLALGTLLIATGVGLALRARAALLITRVGLGVLLAALVITALRLLLGSASGDTADDALVAHARLFGYALAAAAVVLVLLLLRLARATPTFHPMDLVPLGGVAAALALSVVWLLADDARLRPCRNGNAEACHHVATTLLEASERAVGRPPSRGEKRAARVLAERRCRPADLVACAVERYAVGTVEARAGRVQTAKEAFLWACDAHRSWCARAAQEARVAWTPEEIERLRR
jgi:hypothetical protein